LEKASSHGPWTRQALELIDRNPGVVSTVLAAKMGLERPVFKIDIRKLKESGLTESLEVGYRLSPRGKRLRAHLRTPANPRPHGATEKIKCAEESLQSRSRRSFLYRRSFARPTHCLLPSPINN